jgi:hypothetical protein
MPTSKKSDFFEVFERESERVHGTWTVEPPRDPEEQARAHRRDLAGIVARTVLTLAAFGLVYGLSALFLKHGNAEQAEKVVIAALGVVGGFGIGEIGRKVASKD